MKFLYTTALFLLLASSGKAQLIINEICYDPSNTALEGDANGDGVYDQTQDEFIEFVNVGSSPLDISKYKIYDHVLASGLKTLRHTVENGIVLPAGGCMVVFGGGTATGSFGGAYVSVDIGTAGLSLGNTGESVILTDSMGVFIDSIDTDALSNNPDESYTRNPDLTGDFVQHGTAQSGVLFSPGFRVDGGLFAPYTSVASTLKFTGVQAFPNPGKGIFYFTGTPLDGEPVLVFDAMGKTVFSTRILQQKADFGLLPQGMYRVKVGNGRFQNLVVLP